MEFTFGIITGGGNELYITEIINSIYSLNIPKYEIIVVGSCNLQLPNLRVFNFDESIKSRAWISKKKNLITHHANFENIVYTHDYIKFDSNFYTGWLEYGDKFNACMNKIYQINGERFRDWLLWLPGCAEIYLPELKQTRGCLLPYTCTEFSKIMYFSGSYFVAKKKIMKEIPLNEDLCWGQGEDVEWSFRYRDKYVFDINPLSSVTLLKNKPVYYGEISSTELQALERSYSQKKVTQTYDDLYRELISL